MDKISVVKYNPRWKNEFEKAKHFFNEIFRGIDLHIVHVGSTSIEGLWDKAILDIDIIVKNEDDSRSAIERLSD